MFVDTHCHLDFPDFDQDRDEVISRARSGKISYLINIGSSLEGSKKSLALAKGYDFIYAAVGIHPHQADKTDEQDSGALLELTRNKKVVAIGETGLDYYKNYSQAEKQIKLFASLLKLAKDLELPLVIHSRQAEAEVLKFLKEAMPIKAVVHCFSGDKEYLAACLRLGFLVSFTCNITYRKAQKLRDLVRLVPLERLMLETDAPFLPPEGRRGKRNEPAYLGLLAEEIARIKQISTEEVARVTTENARGFFRLP